MSVTKHSTSLLSNDLLDRYRAVRDFTMKLCEPLSPEDCCIQGALFASPTRWHLAHTSWFFETFLLKSAAGYRVFDPHYEVLFNSYYNTVGEQFPRARRGLLSRPSLQEVYDYRRHIDDAVAKSFQSGRIDDAADLANIIEWGIHHEQQHQELILTDIKYLLSLNPLMPAYRPEDNATISGGIPRPANATGSADGRTLRRIVANSSWIAFNEGLYEIGHAGHDFAYDNESPRHRVFLDSFRLASHVVTSGEFVAFIEDDGYRRPELWLSDGWAFVNAEQITHPLYWFVHKGHWQEFTLAGLRPLGREAPVCHVSFYEADAYARWAGARLPSEAEWEVASAEAPRQGNFVDALLARGSTIHPQREGEAPAEPPLPDKPQKMFGDVWEWTASAYLAYPGYQPPAGALGEYNGKFMSGQMVLRGGSCATPSTHIRPTYRNFFPLDARWQFTGLRLAQ
jgi:ergothioneine biosynthesis protein EgtB